MVSEQDVRLAELAVELQVLDRPRMEQVIAEIRQLPTTTPLAQYLMQRGLIAPQAFEILKQEWFRRNPPGGEVARPRGLTGSYDRAAILGAAPPPPPPPPPPLPMPPPVSSPNSGLATKPASSPSGSGIVGRPSPASGSGIQSFANPGNKPGSGSNPGPAEASADKLLGMLLAGRQVVPADRLREAAQLAQTRNQRLGRVLVEMQIMPAAHLSAALQLIANARKVCANCGYAHDLAQGPAPACSQCGGAWFEDSVERIMAQPKPQAAPAFPQSPPIPTTPSNNGAPMGMGVPPPMNLSTGAPNQGQLNQGQPNQGQLNQGQPNQGQPSQGQDDFLNAPAGYSDGNKQAWANMMPMSSLRLNVKDLSGPAPAPTPPPRPKPAASGELGDMGMSMDELDIMSGRSMDELNIGIPSTSSDEMSGEANNPALAFAPPMPDQNLDPNPNPKPDLRKNTSSEFPDFKRIEQLTEAKQTKRFSQKPADAPAASGKKGCRGKAAALLLVSLISCGLILKPAFAYALSLF